MKLNWRRLFIGQREKSPELLLPGRTGEREGQPQFPDSAGDRERGKFRPSTLPRGTTVAVVRDDGQSVTADTDVLLAAIHDQLHDIAATLKAIRADLEED